MSDKQVVIIGAGPAGLTAAYELSKHGICGTIFEADTIVGGISRTEQKDGYHFDIGGHRFFSKSQEVVDIWNEILPDDMLTRPRLSRIFYDGKFYDYPLKVSNALKNMGIATSIACLSSYTSSRANPIPDPKSFEEWVTNQFGRKLYSMFFKTYTEKVWGMPCNEIGADWAAQRIKGLSLGEAVKNALFGQKSGKVVKTLIDEFRYPRLGPGQLWERCADLVEDAGWKIHKATSVDGVLLDGGRVVGVDVVSADGLRSRIPCNYVLSSMPVSALVRAISPFAPENVAKCAGDLRYRDFLTVALVLEAKDVFPDNWIYIHSPEVIMGRIQNFKNWSPSLVPDASTTCLGLEYFVNEGDKLWQSPDEDLVALGYSELGKLGFDKGSLRSGYVVRMPKAYPVYDTGYQSRLDTIRTWLSGIDGLYCMGRNGQHRYNNMDHSMMTALIAARNIAQGEARDPWSVNEDAEYHEEKQ